MIQDSRDAEHILRGLWVQRSAGSLRDGYCCALGVVRPADAPPWRGLQDRGAQCRHVPVPWRREEDHCGRREGSGGLIKLSQWLLGDSLPKGANRTATLGDHRRQILSLRSGAGGRVLRGWRWPARRRDRSEDKHAKRFMTVIAQRVARANHVRSLMRSGRAGRKASDTTTKNDNMKNRLDILHFLL